MVSGHDIPAENGIYLIVYLLELNNIVTDANKVLYPSIKAILTRTQIWASIKLIEINLLDCGL